MIQTPGPITFTVLPLFTPITLIHIQSNSLYQNTIPFYNTFSSLGIPLAKAGLLGFRVFLSNLSIPWPVLVSFAG